LEISVIIGAATKTMMSPKKNPKNMIIFRAVKTVWRAKSSLSRTLYSEKYLAIAGGSPNVERIWNIT